MAQPTVKYMILPAKIIAGQQIVIKPIEDYDEAKRELVKQTAATGEQHILYTSTHYTEAFEEWPIQVIDTIVQPYVP